MQPVIDLVEPAVAKAKKPRASSPTVRPGSGSKGATVAQTKKMTLALSQRAHDRLSNYCHATKVNPAEVVAGLILQHVELYVLQRRSKAEDATLPATEDRQSDPAA